MSQELAKVAVQLSALADVNKQLVSQTSKQTEHLAQIEATLKELLKVTREEQNPQAAARLKELRATIG